MNTNFTGSNQDFTIVTFSKKKPQRTEPITPKEPKPEDPEGEKMKVPKFSHQFTQEVIKRRVEKKWNQEQLANQLRVQKSVIQNFEQKKLKYDGNLVHKLKRLLGPLTSNPKDE